MAQQVNEQDKDGVSAIWRHEQGFEPKYEQRTPVELKVVGSIPKYAAGVLYRTGPGGHQEDGPNGKPVIMSHWFDGFTQVHRFKIDATNDATTPIRVFYNSRLEVDEILQTIRETGDLKDFTFGQKRDPCESFFQKVMSTFTSAVTSAAKPSGPRGPTTANVGVTLSVNLPGFQTIGNDSEPSIASHSSGIKTLHNKTDANIFQQIDPETLEPIGLATQTSLHPLLKGPMSAAHAKADPETGDIFNYNLDIGMKSTYQVFHTSASTGQTEILATIQDRPAYLHSLFLSGSYVILCIWSAHYSKAGVSLLANKNILESIAPFDPTKKAKWYVIDRRNGKGLVATYESDPFFCFHTINAWERPSPSDPSKTEIVCDVTKHDNLDILHALYYKSLMSIPTPDVPRPSVARFVLPDVPSTPSSELREAKLVFDSPKDFGAELPIINPAYFTKEARYVYGIANRGRSTLTDGLVKFDYQTQTTVYWEKWSHTPGEPIFVADPEGSGEDDGVLLSVVLDGEVGKSYLLCLDARTMEEVGRAEVDGVVGFGFHGRHVRL
ncbi:beta,beta-carotene 9',10'-dioxygenase [Lophium mytilinum]|uniref:Beta,beta-carotene 9',10'-dioxygenase n=1 Tax=Lophium mytilinum TaxID=390894 RepID=A0A6A6QWF0_9PEZI|nr:beta,beta-carotene 9',10'-dioxygenase [Lophium mytilinum]